MSETAITFGLGALIGAAFALAKAVPPAPPTIQGIMGIVGIWAGWAILSHLLGR
jgi:XapX domain-containing protein